MGPTRSQTALVIRAQSYFGSTIVLPKKDHDMLTAHYRNGKSFKGALLLIGDAFDKKIVSREDTFFLNQIDRNNTILKKLTPAPIPGDASLWDHTSRPDKNRGQTMVGSPLILRSL